MCVSLFLSHLSLCLAAASSFLSSDSLSWLSGPDPLVVRSTVSSCISIATPSAENSRSNSTPVAPFLLAWSTTDKQRVWKPFRRDCFGLWPDVCWPWNNTNELVQLEKGKMLYSSHILHLGWGCFVPNVEHCDCAAFLQLTWWLDDMSGCDADGGHVGRDTNLTTAVFHCVQD